MTMTTQEMIEVLQAYERGEKIEVKTMHNGAWLVCEPSWDFDSCDYRIAKPEPKKITLKAFISKNDGRLTFDDCPDPIDGPFWRVPQFDCEVEES